MKRDIYHLKRDNNPRRKHALTFSCLGKLFPASKPVLKKWGKHLRIMLHQALQEKSISRYPLVIGLAESGLVPSAMIHQILREKGIHAHWLCSTRRPACGIRFTESHSHAPDHVLRLPHYPPTELWFVEDEITTGKTLLRLATALCNTMNIRQVRFFAIADSRNFRHIDRFKAILHRHHIEYTVHTMLRLSPPEEDMLSPINCESGIGRQEPIEKCSENSKYWYFPYQRAAFQNQLDQNFPFPKNLKGSLLVVGEAVDIALRFVMMNPELSFHHITLSPWQIDGVNIVNRLTIGRNYYLYNYHTLKPPLYIISDPIDAAIGREAQRLLATLKLNAKHLILAS